MSRLIGFCGLAGSGKDTSGDFLVKNANYVKLACADPLKRICQQVYAFTDEQLWGPSSERNKPDKRYWRMPVDKETLDRRVEEWHAMEQCSCEEEVPLHDFMGLTEAEYKYWVESCGYLTPRYALQQLGTEWGRDCYPNTWIDLAIRTATSLRMSGVLRSVHYKYTAKEGLITGCTPFGPRIGGVAITDVRFLNEVLAINNAGGEVYLLTRGLGLEGASGQHKSETEMKSIPRELFKGIIDNNEWELDQLENFLKHLTAKG